MEEAERRAPFLRERRRSHSPVLVVTATVLLGLCVVYWYRAVFGPLLLALALAYMYEPLVARLCARHALSRHLAVLVIFLGTSLVGVIVLALLSWQAADMIGKQEGPLRDGLLKIATRVSDWVGGVRGKELAEKARALVDSEAWQAIVSTLGKIGVSLTEGISSALNLLSILFLLPVYVFYLMLALPDLWNFVLGHLPRSDRERTLRVFTAMHEGLAAFFRGRVVVAILKGGLTSIGLTLVGTPSAVAFGLVNGLLSVLPYVGPILAFACAALATIAMHQELAPVAWAGLVFLLAEGIEGFVLTPWIMGTSLALHPLTMLFCVVFWAYALGLFGALVAIPLTLIVKILLREYVLPSVEKLAK